jgi:hypothetical protein
MHVIVAGTARSGKTTLSLMMNKYGYTHYKMDSIKRGICEAYKLTYDDWEELSPIICTIINKIITDNKTDINYGKEKYLFDTPFIYPKDIHMIDTSETKVIFLGYAHISVDEAFKTIRENNLENFWTHKISDEELREWVKGDIEFSQYLEKECERLGFTYYDTSYNREEVLNKALNDIINS